MIISLVRSEGIGFLKDIRRANVATSRAQYGQFIFGNSNVLMNYPLWKEIYGYMAEKKFIVEYVEENLKIKQDFYKLLFKNK